MGALEQHLVTEKVSISHDNYICRTWYSRQGTRNLLREYPQLRKLSVFDCFFFFFFSLMKTIQKVRVCRRSAQTLLLCEQWRKKKKGSWFRKQCRQKSVGKCGWMNLAQRLEEVEMYM